MNNRGQTTVLFSCMISIFLIFTLTALEVGRIYCSKLKIRAVVHSACSSIMADYNRELFERYHLLFLDPGYGTGSDAVCEEKLADYLDVSLNGQEYDGKLYSFEISELAIAGCERIMDDHMKLLKRQISEYEKEAGAVKKIVNVGEKFADSSKNVMEAGERTERNATEIPIAEDEGAGLEEEDQTDDAEEEGNEEKVDDPRDTLKQMLSAGYLALLLPEGTTVPGEPQDFSDSPSAKYTENGDKDRDSDFQDVTKLVDILGDSAEEEKSLVKDLGQKAGFCAYVTEHFSYQGKYENSVMQCEAEYIIKGKDNDHDNLEAVLSDIVWMRMPVNYVYLLSDEAKGSEALTLAAAICSATGIPAMTEIVKYLLLGCWSYGESIYEVRILMRGGKLPYVKTAGNWNTDLKTLTKSGEETPCSVGMDYEDYLCLMLAKKESKDITYARMLDLIEKNLREKDEKLTVVNLCGKFTVQGKISLNPLLIGKGDSSAYEYYFEEDYEY